MKSLVLHFHKVVVEVIGALVSPQKLIRLITIPLYRNALHLILNTVVTSLLGYFFWIIVARFYSETEVGLGSATISAINLIGLLGGIGLNFSLIRFLPQVDIPQKLINWSFTLSGLISLFIAIIFVTGLDIWSPALIFIKQNAIFVLAFLIMAMVATMSNLMDSVFVARRKAVLVLSRNAILSLLKIPFLVAFVAYFHTFGVVASWGISLGIAFIISIFLFLPKVEAGYRPAPSLTPGYVKGIRYYSGSSYLASLLAGAPNMILPIMVVNLLGAEGNAYFYVAWIIASFLFAIPQSVSRSLFAEGSHSKENIKEEARRSIKFTFLLLVPAVVVLMVSGKWILLAFGENYSVNALMLLQLLTISTLPRGISQVYISLLRVQDKLKELIIIRMFTAVAVLTLSFLIMPATGIIGVGYVWLGVHGVLAIILTFRLGNQLNRFSRSGGDDWVDARRV